MRILILDDMKIRHDTYAERYAGNDIVHTYNFFAFLDALHEQSPFDLIHLDHDLGDFVTNPDYWVDGWGHKREFNGQNASFEVARLDDELLPSQVIIHSINPVGAKAMFEIIKKKGLPVSLQPFNEFE